MFIGNQVNFGGKLETSFSSEIVKATKVDITTGYFGASLMNKYSTRLTKIVRSGGTVRVLVGMVFHVGIRRKQYEALKNLDDALRLLDPKNGSGVYISRLEYHGKLYSVDKKIIIGSSNFSDQGFRSRLECNLIIDGGGENVTSAQKYIDHLFKLKTTAVLNDVNLSKVSRKAKLTHKERLSDFSVDESPLKDHTILGFVDIELRVDEQPRSSLNLFFDKGRKANGKYAPRPWNEIEITSSTVDRKNPFYPCVKLHANDKAKSREFDAFLIDDTSIYKIKMVVGSAYGKALTSAKSSGGRAILGQFIKGNLKRIGALKQDERVTSEILDIYGRNTIRFNKVSDDLYIVDFRRNQPDS